MSQLRPRIGVVSIRTDPGRAKSSLPRSVQGYWANTSCQALPYGSRWQAGRQGQACHAQPRWQSQHHLPIGEGIPCPANLPPALIRS